MKSIAAVIPANGLSCYCLAAQNNRQQLLCGTVADEYVLNSIPSITFDNIFRETKHEQTRHPQALDGWQLRLESQRKQRYTWMFSRNCTRKD
jgi:hypothetical protein